LIIPKAISPAGVSANAVLNAFCIDESDRDADSADGLVSFRSISQQTVTN
jgi:hypothetical protein